MDSDIGEGAATLSAQAEENNASETSRFLLRETVPYWDEAEYRRLCPNKLDAKRFGAIFSDVLVSTVLDRRGAR